MLKICGILEEVLFSVHGKKMQYVSFASEHTCQQNNVSHYGTRLQIKTKVRLQGEKLFDFL
jgi:hypothetical protein